MTAPVTYFVSASGESGFPKHRNGGAVSGSNANHIQRQLHRALIYMLLSCFKELRSLI